MRRRLQMAGYKYNRVEITILSVWFLFVAVFLTYFLYMVFAPARSRSGISCISYTKQVGLSFQMYLQDNDGVLPGNFEATGNVPKPDGSDKTVVSWADAIFEYTKSRESFQCPQAKDKASIDALRKTDKSEPVATSYLYNGLLERVPLSRIAEPNNTIVLHENDRVHRFAQQAPYRVAGNESRATAITASTFDKQHSDGGNFAFVDGHAKYKKRGSISYAEFGLPDNLNPGLPPMLPSGDAELDAHTTDERITDLLPAKRQ